jgi:hypothetical protein
MSDTQIKLERKISTILANGVTTILTSSNVAVHNSGSKVADTVQQVHTASQSADPASVAAAGNAMSGFGGWGVLIIATLALIAGLVTIYLLTRPHPVSTQEVPYRGHRRRWYTPIAKGDPMSPFSPKRGLG